MNLMHQ